MKYIIEPSVFTLNDNIGKKEFDDFVTRIFQWEELLNKYPNNIYVFTDTIDKLLETNLFPVNNALSEIIKKYNVKYVQVDNLNKTISRLLTKAKKIDEIKMEDCEILTSQPSYLLSNEEAKSAQQPIFFVDSSAHKLRKTGRHIFELHNNSELIKCTVQLKLIDLKAKVKTQLFIKNDRELELILPIKENHTTMSVSPIEIETSGTGKFFLSFLVKPTKSIFKTKEVVLSLYSSIRNYESR